jgi:hypothetical protein
MLAHRIKRELNLGESTHCAVYEDELIRLWPLNHKEREAKIAQFAEEYGFRLRFTARDSCALVSYYGALSACPRRHPQLFVSFSAPRCPNLELLLPVVIGFPFLSIGRQPNSFAVSRGNLSTL